MLSILAALWLLFGLGQGSEGHLAAYPSGLGSQKTCCAIEVIVEETEDDASKPKVVRCSWDEIKRIYMK